MRRGRVLIFVVLILIVGLVIAGVVAYQFLSQGTQQAQPTNVDVYVVSQSIPSGGEIKESVLTTISLPQDKVAAVMFTTDEFGSLAGKVARYPLDPGVILTEAMVGDRSTAVPIAGPEWASVIPTGMVAKTIPASRLKLAGFAVSNGAHVNINACFLFVDVDPTFQTILPNQTAQLAGAGSLPDALPTLSLGVGAAAGPQGRIELEPSVQQPYYLIPNEKDAEGQRPRPVCQMLLQDITVMRVGNFPPDVNATTTTTTAPAADQTQTSAPVMPDIVTLIVSPQDSVTLDYLMYTSAQLNLTLRNPSDQSRQNTEPSTLQFILSQYNIPVPAKLPYSMQPAVGALNAPLLPNDAVTVSP